MLRRAGLALGGVLVAILIAAPASAAVERTSYWPDPAAERVDGASVGGAVPKIRSLSSALKRSKRSRLHVVCRPNRVSLRRALKALEGAPKRGFRVLPTESKRKISKKKARKLAKIQKRLHRKCKFSSIQKAVKKADNHDRIVVMPGRYPERPSRQQKINDPRCKSDLETIPGRGKAPRYSYHFRCPNSRSLVTIAGRRPGPGEDPPPQADREGIPNSGSCIRCGIQIEGSGLRPDSVLIDAAPLAHHGRRGAGTSHVTDKPAPGVRDVILRADRADGVVLRNMTFRGARENGVQIHETDGFVLDRVKFFYNEGDGVQTLASDHGGISNCEGLGNGRSAVAVVGSPDSGSRMNQRVTGCDLHRNTSGLLGRMANGLDVKDNNVYGNAAGVVLDSSDAVGSPGYPQDGARVRGNRIYKATYNPYTTLSALEPRLAVPVGTGVMVRGGNGNEVTGNHIFFNFRRGVMLAALSDAHAGSAGAGDCGGGDASTSCDNRFVGNVFGTHPPGFNPELKRSGVPRQANLPNGVDIWWDEAAASTGNCWPGNSGQNGARADLNTDPPLGPTPGGTTPGFLPESCGGAVGGTVGAGKQDELNDCRPLAEGETAADRPGCPWFESPPFPGARK